MEGSTTIREYLIDVGSDMDDKSSGRTPTDDQFFLLYFIMGTYFGPDLMGEKTHKSVFQRRAEALPPYTPQKLAGSCMKTVQVERIYYYVLRKADPSLVLKLPWLRQFFHGNLCSCTKTPQFDDLFPPQLHPHSMLKGEYEVINNIVFISDPKMVYIGSEYLERFKRLTRLEEVCLDRDEAMLHTSVDGKVLYNIDVQEIEYHNTSLPANGVPIRSVVEMKMKDMIFLPCHPTREEWINMVSATKSGCALTGSAAMGQIGPSIGCIDIGECEDSYLFRVSLPGVKRDEREFSCEVEDDGKVSVRGVTVTGEKRVCRFEQIFEMQSHKLCPPGHFSLSFKLPGPVDPQQFSGNFGTDGILEGIVMKPPNTKHHKTSLLP